jgi:hypothetical protein
MREKHQKLGGSFFVNYNTIEFLEIKGFRVNMSNS